MKTFKRTVWGIVGMIGVLGAFSVGCDRPEVSRDEYGTVIEEFPNFPDAPKALPLPEGVLSNENP